MTAIPGFGARLSEVVALVPRLLNGFGHNGPRGPVDGPPALVLPGFLATDRTVIALRDALGQAGWRAYPWAMGWNKGARDDTLDRLERRIAEVGKGRKVLLVGWSLGGLFARELARAVPDQVRAVVTLGSPFSDDPRLNNVWRLYELVAGHSVDNPPLPRITAKPPVPTLAIWSRQDGLVAPLAAMGKAGERDEAVELPFGHMAFGVSRTAGRAIAGEIVRFLEAQGVGVGVR